MIYLKETTVDWDADYIVPSHVYIVDDKKEFCLGYIPEGTDVERMFVKKKPFSTSRRKFKVVTKEFARDLSEKKIYAVQDYGVVVP